MKLVFYFHLSDCIYAFFPLHWLSIYALTWYFAYTYDKVLYFQLSLQFTYKIFFNLFALWYHVVSRFKIFYIDWKITQIYISRLQFYYLSKSTIKSRLTFSGVVLTLPQLPQQSPSGNMYLQLWMMTLVT